MGAPLVVEMKILELTMHNAYGARSILMRSLNLRSSRMLKIPEIVWQHGWAPSVWNFDIDHVIGESGQTSELSHLTYLVARRDQEQILKESGIANAFAVGLPFAYALQMVSNEHIARASDSLLVVPALHGSYSPESAVHLDTEYLDFLQDQASDYELVTVMMNCDDLRLGRHFEWMNRGFHVVEGGCESDSKSLERLARILLSYDVMTTNDFGSHVAYAAAAGCGFAICGPSAKVDLAGYSFQDSFYQNRPELGLASNALYEKARGYLSDLGFFRDIAQAKEAEAWGHREIGFDMIPSPKVLRAVISSAYMRHTSPLDRVGLRPLKKRVRSLQRFLAVAAIREPDGKFPNPLTFRKNLWTLIKKSGEPLRSISLTDSRTLVRFRPESSDIDNLYQHFVERELDGFDLGQPSRILDIGSYAGYSILFLTKKFPSAEIVGVEADSENFELCAAHHANNPMVKLINKAIWSENTPLSLLAGPEGAWSNKTIPQMGEFPTIEGITLLDILQEVGWDSVDVIKMDIEGSEYGVLASVAPDISQICSVLLVEFHHKLARKRELDALIQRITSGSKVTVTEVGEFTVFDFR